MVIRYKVRLVAKECLQVEGLDFGKIFASVAKFKAIRIIFAVRKPWT